jgi:hypothetical protein
MHVQLRHDMLPSAATLILSGLNSVCFSNSLTQRNLAHQLLLFSFRCEIDQFRAHPQSARHQNEPWQCPAIHRNEPAQRAAL